MRLRRLGHRICAEVGIVVDAALGLTDAHAIAIKAHHQLLHQVPKLTEVTVHVSPDGPIGAEQNATLAHHQGA